jgi:hypothetical protein
VVKIMLNLSRREQANRFVKRIDHPEKNWKLSASDARSGGHGPGSWLSLPHGAPPDRAW